MRAIQRLPMILLYSMSRRVVPPFHSMAFHVMYSSETTRPLRAWTSLMSGKTGVK
jgi:hypothetical protein